MLSVKRFITWGQLAICSLAFFLLTPAPAGAQDFVRQQIGTVNYTIPLLQQRYNSTAFNPPLIFDVGTGSTLKNIFQVVPPTTANTFTFAVTAPAQASVLTFPDPGGATVNVAYANPTSGQTSLVINGATSGSTTLSTTAVAGSSAVVIPAVSATVMEQTSAVNCGTTTTCAATAQTNWKIAYGTVALSSATPSTAVVASIPAFTSTTSFTCMATNQTTQANPVKVVNTSTTSITITGPNTVTDTIGYFCWGT